MRVLLELDFIAPVPIGHRVTVLSLEKCSTVLSLFGGAQPGSWAPLKAVIVCDESTHILYADRNIGLHPEATYEHLRFKDESFRISTVQPSLRGRVSSCVVLSDYGDRINLKTFLGVDQEQSHTSVV